MVDSSIRDAKTRQLGLKYDGTESNNRFDDLPQELLVHILSFLPIESVIQASLVCKRWKDLWMSIPNLNFKLQDEYGDRYELLSAAASRRPWFLNYVNRVLWLRNSCKINRFSLDLDVELDSHLVFTWIDYAVNHGVQELELSLYCDHVCFDSPTSSPKPLPDSLFTCKSLTKMHLQFIGSFRLPPTVHFPNLKVLRLNLASFWDDQLTSQLFSNCPLLEELYLWSCCWTWVKSVYISAPRLSVLSILEDDDYSFSNKCQVFIHGTSLKCFRLLGEYVNEYCFVSSCSLQDASIELGPLRESGDQKKKKGADRTHKLLKGLYHVNSLKVSYDTLQALNYKEDLFSQMPVFQNLTHLQFAQNNCWTLRGGPMDIWCGGLFNLLRHLPSLFHLEALEGMILSPLDGDEDTFGTLDLEEDTGWMFPLPQCFETSLKIITFGMFRMTTAECDSVKFLLEVSRVLEKFHIKCIGGEKAKRGVFSLLEEQSLSEEKLARVSVSCTVSGS